MRRPPWAALGALSALVALTTACATDTDVVESAPFQTPGPELPPVLEREASFTQGLELLPDGTMLHSRGLYGESGVDLLSADGAVLRSAELPPDQFGEGITVVPHGFDDEANGPTAYQLTWQSGEVHTWSLPDLAKGTSLAINSEGWGLCYDDMRESLWLSDGTAILRELAVADLAVLSEVTVTEADGGDLIPVTMLNELECVGGKVWANVWMQDDVVLIDPGSGEVTERMDLSDVVAEQGSTANDDVLNGIAYDERDEQFLITGKNWSQIYRVDLEDS